MRQSAHEQHSWGTRYLFHLTSPPPWTTVCNCVRGPFLFSSCFYYIFFLDLIRVCSKFAAGQMYNSWQQHFQTHSRLPRDVVCRLEHVFVRTYSIRNVMLPHGGKNLEMATPNRSPLPIFSFFHFLLPISSVWSHARVPLCMNVSSCRGHYYCRRRWRVTLAFRSTPTRHVFRQNTGGL